MPTARIGHKPERSCIICKKKAAKYDLFRIVRTPSGEALYDETGNAAGRGAYVCSMDCFRSAIENGKLARSLRMKLTEEISRIEEEIALVSPEKYV